MFCTFLCLKTILGSLIQISNHLTTLIIIFSLETARDDETPADIQITRKELQYPGYLKIPKKLLELVIQFKGRVWSENWPRHASFGIREHFKDRKVAAFEV